MIYVDKPFRWPGKRGVWCHMISTIGREELDAFARKIGLKSCWRQHSGKWNEHYDLRDGAISRALAAGAILVDKVTFIDVLRGRRD